MRRISRGSSRPSTLASLTFAAGTAVRADRRAFTACLGAPSAVDWVVYAKRPFGGLAQVLEYVGRYTHRVALSNDRLVAHRDGCVRFRWKDYADHDRVKVMTLEADEFHRRFLLHVVPRGFMRIRHCRPLANRTQREAVGWCRDLLAQPPPKQPPSNPHSRSCGGSPASTSPSVGYGEVSHMQRKVFVVPAKPALDTS